MDPDDKDPAQREFRAPGAEQPFPPVVRPRQHLVRADAGDGQRVLQLSHSRPMAERPVGW